MDPARDYPMRERLQMQQVILNELDSFYASFDKNAVFDRTPLDAAAYMLADVQRENLDSSTQDEVTKYVERCLEITNRRFAMLLFVPPVLKLQYAEGKAPAESAYVAHISYLIDGLRHDERMKVRHFTMPRGYLDIDIRVKALGNATARVLSRFVEESEQMGEAGIEFH